MTKIHATGTSSSHYPAERATITAHVSEVSRDLSTSISLATSVHNRLVQRAQELRSSGDATWHSAEPISTWARKTYEEGSTSKVVIEHVTSSRIRVKLSNLKLVSEVVTEFANMGVETNVSWSLTEVFRRECERTARKAAVGSAREVADDYAEALGEQIVHVVSISDNETHSFEMPMARMASAMHAETAEVSIAEITVSATVAGVFESE